MSLRETGKFDSNNKPIYENDVLYNRCSGYKYTVKYGDFIITYTKDFPIKCLGFYVEYIDLLDNTKCIDSFAMLNLKNLEKEV